MRVQRYHTSSEDRIIITNRPGSNFKLADFFGSEGEKQYARETPFQNVLTLFFATGSPVQGLQSRRVHGSAVHLPPSSLKPTIAEKTSFGSPRASRVCSRSRLLFSSCREASFSVPAYTWTSLLRSSIESLSRRPKKSLGSSTQTELDSRG
jgi:hypothetical protein